jgi:hypothetical protein
MREVVRACTELLGTPVLDEYTVSGVAGHVSLDEELLTRTSRFLHIATPISKRSMQLVPLPKCVRCCSLIAPVERVCATSGRDFSVPRVTMCNKCGKAMRCATCGTEHPFVSGKKRVCCGKTLLTSERVLHVWGMTKLAIVPKLPALVRVPRDAAAEAAVADEAAEAAEAEHVARRAALVPPGFASPWSFIASGADHSGELMARALAAMHRRTKRESLAHYARVLLFPDPRRANELSRGRFVELPESVVRRIIRHVYDGMRMLPTTRSELRYWAAIVSARWPRQIAPPAPAAPPPHGAA